MLTAFVSICLPPPVSSGSGAHGGGINGFSTFIARYPDDNAVVIVLSNNEAGNAERVASKLIETLFAAP